jgi:hypothetical protein
MSYKRNQIEEAIARIFNPNSQEPPSELRTRIKRLLELDRSMGRKLRSKDPEEANFAFFSEDAPGTVEIFVGHAAWLFDLKSEATMFSKRDISATIRADVM